jgi:polysaccharide chain length determinant protein (PEP-CTERM system associated)
MQDRSQKGSGVDLALEVWSRRKWLAILIFAGAFVAVTSLVAFLPNIYRSTTTVLVERQQMPETLVKPTVTSELETRLHTISQQILSRTRLQDLTARFDLYRELRERASPEEVLKRMRRDIEVEFKGVEQQWGRSATIAFTVSYRGRDPETVARVTNTLASFYIEENLKARERQATGAADFLQGQLQEVKQRLDAQERRVSEFKKHHLGELPQQMDANLAILERLNAQLRLNSENQTRAIERREGLVKQLAEAGSSRSTGGPGAPAERLATLRQELTELKTRFSEKYPDVIRVKAEIAALEAQLAETKPDGRPEAEPAAPAGPHVLRFREVLREAEAEIKALKGEEKGLRQAIGTYQRRVENAPQREQEFQELSRDYGALKELYGSLSKRYEDAQLAESMEQHQKGEQFRILDQALPPEQPAAPNRLRLLIMGLLFSLGMAAAAVVLAEQLDSSFHSVGDLRAFTTVPVLASIPRIITEADTGRRRRRLRLVTLSVLLCLALVVGATYRVASGNEDLVLMLAGRRS